MQKKAPKWAMWFLEKTCSPRFLDELQGDFLELFDRDIEQLGIEKARKRFFWKALFSIRWYRLPKLGQIQPNMMHKNHFKVAYRHALKHKSATFIQALGLTLGLAAVIFIGLFIKHELAFDQMHTKQDSLYRVLRQDPTTGERGLSTSSLHGSSLLEEYPFISMCRFGNDPVKMGEVKPILVDDFYWADSTFFELFTFDFLHGDASTCLDQVNNVVLTESISMQLFGTDNSLGRNLPIKVYDGDREFLMTITGIVKDPPERSHIQFKALGAMANAEDLYQSLLKQWGFSWLRTYIEVPENRIAEVESGLPKLIQRHFGGEQPASFGMAFQPFGDIYLHSQDIGKNTLRGSIRNLQIFGAIGLLILIISLMNYVNLATARAVTRLKEVGIRKTLGSKKLGIIGQFIVESSVFTLVSGMAAVLLVLLGLRYLNEILELDLSLNAVGWQDWVVLFAAVLGLGLLAGIIPSVVMARLPMLSDSKSTIQFKNTNWSISRKFFVGIQYLVTLVLLVSTFVIFKQYLYLKNMNLGFDSSQLVHISLDDRQLQQKLEVIKEKTLAIPGVLGATATGEDLPSVLNNTWGLSWSGADPEDPKGVDIVGVDKTYFDLLGIEFLDGRNFVHGFEVDSARSVILNEESLKVMGKTDIVGEQVTIGGRNRTVIGVVKDHHHTSLHSKIGPLAYFVYPPGFRVSPDNLLVKLETDDISTSIEQLEGVWNEFSADPFQYNFVDEAFAAAYGAERRFSALIGFFTIIAIMISIVGLFGLVSFMVQLKLKEISIRRVLGATQLHLMRMLSKDFLLVFVIALVLAIPVALYFINGWLTNYAYRVSVGPVLLVLAIGLCLGISILVIFYHLQRTAKVSPSEVLSGD